MIQLIWKANQFSSIVTKSFFKSHFYFYKFEYPTWLPSGLSTIQMQKHQTNNYKSRKHNSSELLKIQHFPNASWMHFEVLDLNIVLQMRLYQWRASVNQSINQSSKIQSKTRFDSDFRLFLSKFREKIAIFQKNNCHTSSPHIARNRITNGDEKRQNEICLVHY